MAHDYIILLAPERDAPPIWYRVDGGQIVRRGKGMGWLAPGRDGAPDEAVGEAMLVLPPHATTLHWIACPGMTARQGAMAARLMALEASIGASTGANAGASERLHAVVATADDADADASHIVAVTSHGAMAHWISWCDAHGLGDASIVPGALLLPAPDNGFVRALIGEADVVRGPDSAFAGDEAIAPFIIGDAPVTQVPADSIDAALLRALDEPPLNLRQGSFARRSPARFDRARWMRLAVMVGGLALATLLIGLVTLLRLHAETARLNTQTVALAQTVDPAINDPETAESRIAGLVAARGGRGGFTGVMAGLMTAMQANPNVVLTNVSQSADGSLRIQLAATKAEEINEVLIAIQEAGWRLSANAVQQRGARLIADIMVVR
ncbi:MAG TPA: type II secretion system protein GspL [Sphingobium sp.]|nr:type II secretion system protein GspL [Sphingobium sp.]